MRYKQIPDLELPEELELPTCDACGELWLGPRELEQVDGALSKAYDRELNRRADEAASALREVISQRDLERLIGVSAGLLSKIRAGKDTSATLTALLMLLSAEPSRVEELKRLWRCAPDAASHFWAKKAGAESIDVDQYRGVEVPTQRFEPGPKTAIRFNYGARRAA